MTGPSLDDWMFGRFGDLTPEQESELDAFSRTVHVYMKEAFDRKRDEEGYATMVYPAGILKNTATGRFHPILFRMAPMPGNADADMAAQRYRSLGHHTDGFDTLEAAKAHMAEKRDNCIVIDTGREWEWDGADVPALVEFFLAHELERCLVK